MSYSFSVYVGLWKEIWVTVHMHIPLIVYTYIYIYMHTYICSHSRRKVRRLLRKWKGSAGRRKQQKIPQRRVRGRAVGGAGAVERDVAREGKERSRMRRRECISRKFLERVRARGSVRWPRNLPNWSQIAVRPQSKGHAELGNHPPWQWKRQRSPAQLMNVWTRPRLLWKSWFHAWRREATHMHMRLNLLPKVFWRRILPVKYCHYYYFVGFASVAKMVLCWLLLAPTSHIPRSYTIKPAAAHGDLALTTIGVVLYSRSFYINHAVEDKWPQSALQAGLKVILAEFVGGSICGCIYIYIYIYIYNVIFYINILLCICIKM